MQTKEEQSVHPFSEIITLIGSKWRLPIMTNLRMRPWRFNELQKSLNGISQKVLTQNLRAMESDGLIVRTIYPEVPPRVEYSLSELGESLLPIVCSIEQWVCSNHNSPTHN